jgi:hypothetical protein
MVEVLVVARLVVDALGVELKFFCGVDPTDTGPALLTASSGVVSFPEGRS